MTNEARVQQELNSMRIAYEALSKLNSVERARATRWLEARFAADARRAAEGDQTAMSPYRDPAVEEILGPDEARRQRPDLYDDTAEPAPAAPWDKRTRLTK
jgi:hypothetical protein